MGDKHETIKPFIRLKNDIGSEDVHYSLFYESIPNEFKNIALTELNETDDNKRMGLSILRDFLKERGIYGVEDHILITVLRNSKYYFKKSETKLMKHLQTLDMLTKWLQRADMERLKNVLDHKMVGLLPYRDKHGRVILYTTPYDIDLELFSADDFALTTFCLLLYALSFPLTTVVGLSYIGEGKTPSLSALFPIMKAYKKYLPTMATLPFRLGNADVINENFIVRWGYNLARPLIPSKLTQRVKFNGSHIQSLQKFYNPALLPHEFGGTMGPIDTNVFSEDLLNFIKRLKSRNLFLEQ